jgi:hypothetical protein
MQISMRCAIISMLCWIFSGCASVSPRYAHDLPLAFRTRLFDADLANLILACEGALISDGFTIEFSDTSSGVLYTEYLVHPPTSSEIGGTWRELWFLQARAVREKSMLSAELVVEDSMGPSSLMPYDRVTARERYRALFNDIQEQLGRTRAATRGASDG